MPSKFPSSWLFWPIGCVVSAAAAWYAAKSVYGTDADQSTSPGTDDLPKEQQSNSKSKIKHLARPQIYIEPTVARLPSFSSASVTRFSGTSGLVLVSGTLGTLPMEDGNPQIRLISGGLAAQTTQALQNIRTILKYVFENECGPSSQWPSNFDPVHQIAKCTVTLSHQHTDKKSFELMNDSYDRFFHSFRYLSSTTINPPARMSSSNLHLALGAAVEIEVIAQLPEFF